MREANGRPRLNVLSKEMFLSLYLPAMALSMGQGIAAPVLPVYAKSFDVSFEMIRPQMLAFLTAQFLANVTRGLGRGGVLNLYATYTYGVGPATLGVLASVNSALGLPIGFTTGYIMDRWGRKKTIVPGFSLLSVAMLFMAATALFHMPLEAAVALIVGFLIRETVGRSRQTQEEEAVAPDALAETAVPNSVGGTDGTIGAAAPWPR